LIESAARPHTHIEAPPDERAKHAAPDAPAPVIFRADNDARLVNKGRKSTLGYKGFARCDEEGCVDKIHTRPAHVGENPQV
jgi:IS5 family transposase